MELSDILRPFSYYVAIFFNFIVIGTGVGLISVGREVKAFYYDYNSFLDEKYLYASSFLIVIGVTIWITTYFGFNVNNSCMSLTYLILLIVVITLELVAGIGGLVLRSKTDDNIKNAFTKTMTEYGQGNFTEISELWDKVQNNFQCCGIENYTDWVNINSATTGLIPVSCCNFKPGSTGTVVCDANTEDLYRVGCLDKFNDHTGYYVSSIGITALCSALIQLLGVALTCCAAQRLRSEYETISDTSSTTSSE